MTLRWCMVCGAIAQQSPMNATSWSIPLHFDLLECDHAGYRQWAPSTQWCPTCGALSRASAAWLAHARDAALLMTWKRPDARFHESPVSDVPAQPWPPYVVSDSDAQRRYDEYFRRGQREINMPEGVAHSFACNKLAQEPWPPDPFPGYEGDARLVQIYNAAYAKDADVVVDFPSRHMRACKALADVAAERIDRGEREVRRRTAHLQRLLDRLLEGTLVVPVEPQPTAARAVLPGDLIEVHGHWRYVEASAPAFRAHPRDGENGRGWTIHWLSTDWHGAEHSGMSSGTGDEVFMVRRLFHDVGTWSCQTCSTPNSGDACRGCGSTRTERAFYPKTAYDGAD